MEFSSQMREILLFLTTNMAAVTSRSNHQYSTFISPIMHLIGPPRFCISIVFNFSWDGCNTQEKWKTKVMQNFGGKEGALWEMCKWRLAHLSVAGRNEDGVDLVLIQPFLLCYVNHVFLMLTGIFFLSKIYMYKGRRFVLKEGQTQPHVHSKARILSTHWTVKWSIVHLWGYTRHSTGCFIWHPVILFRRDSISRGFNFAISIGKYEKREWNFVIQAFLTSFYFQTVSAY